MKRASASLLYASRNSRALLLRVGRKPMTRSRRNGQQRVCHLPKVLGVQNCCVKAKGHEWAGVQLKAVQVGRPIEQEQPRADALPPMTVQPAAVAAVAAVAVVAALQTGDFALPTYSGNPSVQEVNQPPSCWARRRT